MTVDRNKSWDSCGYNKSSCVKSLKHWQCWDDVVFATECGIRLPLPPSIRSGSIKFSGCSVGRPLTKFGRDAISLFIGGFQYNLPQIFIMRMWRTEKIFKVRGQRSRSLTAYSLWSFSTPVSVIACVQMCECYAPETYISTMLLESLLVLFL